MMESFMSSTTGATGATGTTGGVGSTIKASADAEVTKELTFFETHPKAIAIGCAATTAAIFLALHFGLGIL